MQFQFNTDNHIAGDDRLRAVSEEVVLGELGHLADRLTRIEVHLADENAQKGGADDIRCTLEARPEGRQPHTVVHHAPDITAALRGGARKLHALLDSEFGRLDKRR